MKKTATLVTLVIFSFLTAFTSCKDDDKDYETILKESEIPAEIKSYIQEHFNENTILKAKKEVEANTITYDIDLSENVELEFNSLFKITSINSTKQLPDSVIPEAILDYVKTNYSDNFITDWELEKNHQQVELNNNIELEFDLEGGFIRVDRD